MLAGGRFYRLSLPRNGEEPGRLGLLESGVQKPVAGRAAGHRPQAARWHHRETAPRSLG